MTPEELPQQPRERIADGAMVTLDEIPDESDRRGLRCTHPPRFWSHCYPDGYRYCTNCWRVRVRC